MDPTKPNHSTTWPVRPRAFHVMVKPRGAVCNLDCAYCFYLKKEALYPGGSFKMTDEVLETFTRQYIESQQVPEVTFAWQGGEPVLMGLDFFRKAVALQDNFRRPGMTIHNSLQTNGTLLDDEWGAFLRERSFLVGVSIDGPETLHDAFRRDKGGGATFGRVMRGIGILKKHGVEFNTLTCVSAASTDHGLDVYRFLRDEVGSKYMQLIPIIEREQAPEGAAIAKVTRRSVSGAGYGRFLIDIFDEWIRRDVGLIFVQPFDTALAAWTGQPAGLCVYAPTCGLALAMEYNGDLYACDHFVEPGRLLGSITQSAMQDLLMAPTQYRFGQEKLAGLTAYCRSCEVRFACNGGCPKDRLMKTPSGEPGLNALCAGYRAFFNYIDRPMKQMAALLRLRRAPAEMMRIEARRVPLRETPAGQPCPCGSGREVEQCHRAEHGYIPPGHAVPAPVAVTVGKKRH